MNVLVTDSQVIGETEGTLLSLIQQGPIASMFILTNSGSNTANYRFQENIAGTWTDLDDLGTDVHTTLTAGQTRQVVVASDQSQVRLLGYASGGAKLDFAVLRYQARSSGGALPILSL